MHQNNNTMSTINTRLFSLEELQFKKYGVLINGLNMLVELASELEYSLEEINELESEQGFLDSETLSDMNFITTQLDYLYKNLNTTLAAMKFQEAKAFFKVTDLPLVCLN